MRLQALVLLSAFIMLTGLLHASLFITPPGYSTIVSNSPLPCTPVITVGSAIPATEGGGAILTSLPANSYAIEIAIVATILSIMLVAIMYMVGKLFPHSGIMGWINQEYWEIAKSVLIVIIIFGLLAFLSNVAVSMTNTPVTAYSKTNSYLNNLNGLVYSSETYLLTVDSYTAAGWCTLGTVEFGTALLNSIVANYYVPIPIPIILAGIKLGLSFKLLSTSTLLIGTDPTIGQLQSLLTDTVLLLYYPLSMLDLILIEILPALVWIGLGFFIPFGLVFRSLPFIRRIGASFIAIGIALSLLLPMTLVMLNYPVTQAFQGILPIVTIKSTSSLNCNLNSVVLDFVCKAVGEVISLSSAYQANQLRLFAGFYWGGSAFAGIYTILNVLVPYMAFMLLQEVLLIIDVVIIYSIADNIARALGGSLRTSLGGKLKLI